MTHHPIAPPLPVSPPLASMREVGRALGLRWSAARMLLVASGIEVVDGGSPRRWYVRRDSWDALRKRLRLDRRRGGAA